MIYYLLRSFFQLYFRLLHLVEFSGREQIPAHGPVILCANHASYFDSMLVALCTRRRVRFLIYHTFYDHPLFGFFVRSCGAIPVTQRGLDKEGLAAALAALQKGEVLGIFPEGSLSPTGLPTPARPGAALLAARSGAPLVPITIAGAFFVYPKGDKSPKPGTIQVKIHPPIAIDPGQAKDKGYLQQVSDELMARIGKTLFPALRARRRKEMLLQKPALLALEEYLPAVAALLALLYTLSRGSARLPELLPLALIVILYPLYLQLEGRLPQRWLTRFFRHFLPLALLFPLAYLFILHRGSATPAGHQQSDQLFFPFTSTAAVLYLYAVPFYTYLRDLRSFRRLSLGLQAVFYLAILALTFLPAAAHFTSGFLLLSLMTFLLVYDVVYRQPSVIASFMALAVFKVVMQLRLGFIPTMEVTAIGIPALVVSLLRLAGFPRR